MIKVIEDSWMLSDMHTRTPLWRKYNLYCFDIKPEGCTDNGDDKFHQYFISYKLKGEDDDLFLYKNELMANTKYFRKEIRKLACDSPETKDEGTIWAKEEKLRELYESIRKILPIEFVATAIRRYSQ